MKNVLMLLLLLLITVAVTACSGSSPDSGTQMGGAIQGKALSLANTVSTLAGGSTAILSTDGAGAAASFSNPNGIVRNGDNLFVADGSNNTIRKIVISSGDVTTIAGKAGEPGSTDATGSDARFNWPSGITTDGNNLFVTDKENHTIRKVVISTGVVTTIAGKMGVRGSADGVAAAEFNSPKGITTDKTNLFVSDWGNNTIRKIVISSGEVTTIAGTAGVKGSADGTDAASFNEPYGIILNGSNLFVADAANNSIRKIVISTGVVTTIAGKADEAGSTDATTGTDARFNRPYGITTDDTNLFVTDAANHTIRKIVISTGVVTTLAGKAGESGSTDGIAAARFYAPFSVTTDGSYLFVSDSANRVIRKVDISTGQTSTIAGKADVSLSVDGTGSAAGFDQPAGIATDGANLYVVENVSSIIRKITLSTGAVTTIAGTAGVSGSADGTGTSASFKWPNAITTDGVNLFVTDSDNHTIRKIVISTGVVTTIAGKAGETGFLDGTGISARFNWPAGITTDGTNLFVTDGYNQTIRKIVISTGAVSTIAGKAAEAGSLDGTGSVARFNEPYGIATDGNNIFVSDGGNNTIRKIVISTGVVTTIAGSVGVTGSSDGSGLVALFNSPEGITTDGTNLFVVDAGNNTIRKIVISTGVVTTTVGTAGVSGMTEGTGASAKLSGPEGITTDGTNLFVADSFNNRIRKIQ
jgi:hypothetical protein